MQKLLGIKAGAIQHTNQTDATVIHEIDENFVLRSAVENFATP